MDYWICTLITGVGATAVMDLWGIAREPLLGLAPPDYGLIGRWFGHMPRGRFRHDAIASSPAVRSERVIGWAAHYAIGIAFAGGLIAIWGLQWIRHPTIGAAMLVGIGGVTAPFLIVQPALGAGIAASRMRRPADARVQSVVTHAIFGLGLYAAGWAARFMWTL